MGYIGNEPTTGHFPVDNFTSSGGSTYTLAKAPASAGAIEVSVQGVLQPTTAYTVSGTTLTMAGVTSGVKIFVRHLGETLSLPTPADGSVTTAKLGVNSVDGTKIAMGSDAAGDILYHGATDYARLAKGTAGQQLRMNSGATAPEWATISTPAGGKVLQHKETRYRTTHSTTAQWPNDNTIPQNTEGLTVTELAITPESATSTLYIDYWVTFARSVNDMGSMALFVDSTASAVAVSSAQGNTNMHTMFGNYSVVSASTSARTYKLRAAASPGGAGNLYINMAHSSANWWGAGTIPNCGIRIFELEA